MNKMTVSELIVELQNCPANATINVMARRGIENGESELELEVDNCACDGHNEITIHLY